MPTDIHIRIVARALSRSNSSCRLFLASLCSSRIVQMAGFRFTHGRCCVFGVKFPPNSGDLNPIETVWARLRRDLAVREMADLKAGRCLSVCQYKCRASQILTSYSSPQSGECMSYLSRLLRGMPRRLAKCKANGYGPCGK